MDDFERRLCAQTHNYTSLKRFKCLKWILKHFFTILHSQFNYHTLPVTPFNSFHLSAFLFLECRVWLLLSENEVIWNPKYLFTTISSYFWLIYLLKMLSLLYIPRFHLFHYARHIFSRLRTFHCVCSHLYAAAHSSFIFHSVYTYLSLHKVTTDQQQISRKQWHPLNINHEKWED